MKKELQEELKRFKELITYPKVLTEEMITSPEFEEDKFIEDKENGAVHLLISVDAENSIEHLLYLVLIFTNKQGYDELIFYFSLIDKNNQLVSGKEYIYDRNIVKEYLPKELIGGDVFRDKINKMFNKLITMEKPQRFVIETYEEYKDPKQLEYHKPIIDHILNFGYNIKKYGINVFKKYYWEFVLENEKITEQYEPIKFKPKNEEFHKHIKEKTKRIFENLNKKNLL